MEGQAKMAVCDFKNLIELIILETPPYWFHKVSGSSKSNEHLKHKGCMAAERINSVCQPPAPSFVFWSIPWSLPSGCASLGLALCGFGLRSVSGRPGRRGVGVGVCPFCFLSPSVWYWQWPWPSVTSYNRPVSPPSLQLSPASSKAVSSPSPSCLWLLKPCHY